MRNFSLFFLLLLFGKGTPKHTAFVGQGLALAAFRLDASFGGQQEQSFQPG